MATTILSDSVGRMTEVEASELEVTEMEDATMAKTFRTTEARKTIDATLYRFRFHLEWKGRTGEVVIVATGIDDASAYFRDNAKAISGFPRSAYHRNDYLGMETPEDRAARAVLDPVSAELVRIAQGR
jgi:hypothetical protein